MRHSTLIEERHGFVRDDLTKLANNADILIVADPWDPDATHARNIMAEVPTARWFPLPGGAHPAMSLLNEYKMVSKFVRSILRGDFTAAAWRLEIKEKRRLAQRYWLSLAKASLARGTRGRDLALRAAKHALTLAPPPDKSVRTAAQVLLDAKDFEGAAAIFAGFHDAIATSPVSMAIYAGTLLRIGNHSDAIPLIEKIAALDPANKRLPILRRNLENSMPTVSP
jgi:tetratricopeptide (TPR) repeat protein